MLLEGWKDIFVWLLAPWRVTLSWMKGAIQELCLTLARLLYRGCWSSWAWKRVSCNNLPNMCSFALRSRMCWIKLFRRLWRSSHFLQLGPTLLAESCRTSTQRVGILWRPGSPSALQARDRLAKDPHYVHQREWTLWIMDFKVLFCHCTSPSVWG